LAAPEKWGVCEIQCRTHSHTYTHTHSLTPRGGIRLLHSLVALVLLLLKIANHTTLPPRRQPAAKISHICAFFRTGPASKITSAPHLIDGHKQDQEPKEKKCSLYPAADCVTPLEFFMHLIIVARNIVPRRVAKYLHKCAQARRAFPASCRSECTRFKSDTTSI
jgi:hypothetical protein